MITHNRPKSFIAISTLLFFSIVSASTFPAYAYNTHPWKIIGKSASYTWGDNLRIGGSVLKSAWESADDDWMNTSSANFYYNSRSVNTLNTFNERSTTLHGRTTSVRSGGVLTSFNAMLNSGNHNIFQANVARSTANHELGHVLGIDDIYSGTAIMNVNRNRSVIYVPQADDINGINAIYG